MDAHHDPRAGVHPLELLADDAQRDVVGIHASVLRGEADAGKPTLAEALEEFRRGICVGVPLAESGQDRVERELPGRLADQGVFGCGREVHREVYCTVGCWSSVVATRRRRACPLAGLVLARNRLQLTCLSNSGARRLFITDGFH